MNKKNNRKGFTIVELVIVIAVIAILATVLVPTFGDVISGANDSKTVQAVKNAYTTYTVENATTAGYTDNIVIKYGNAYYKVENGAVVDADGDLIPAAEADYATKYWDADTSTLMHKFTDAEGSAADGTAGKGDCDVCGEATGHASHIAG